MDDCASAFRIRQRSLKDCTVLLLVQISKSSGSHPGQVCYLILIIGIAQNLRLIAYEGFTASWSSCRCHMNQART